MKLSTVLRNAARLVERGEWGYSCCAVSTAAKPNHDDVYNRGASERIAYQELLLGPGETLDYTDFDGPHEEISARDAQNHRVLALCMAATLAEEQGL